MVKYGLLPAVLVACLASACSADAQCSYSGTFPASTAVITPVTLTVSTLPRDVLVYRPSTASSRAPLVIILTGTGGTIDYNLLDELGRETVTGLADANGFVVAAPMQREMPVGDWDNHSEGQLYWETAAGGNTDSPVNDGPVSNPDLALVQAIIDEAATRYNVDANRVYLYGFSNGAFFSFFSAAVFRDRIAAFSESGGGLVLSNTTAGDPVPCVPAVNPGPYGVNRSCTAAGWTPGTCAYPGAIPRPVSPSAFVTLPPGFLHANDSDTTVPWAHTCNLAEALSGRAAFEVQIARVDDGHSPIPLETAWNFLRLRMRDVDSWVGTGGTSEWHSAGKWSGGVPGSATRVEIGNGSDVTISSGPAVSSDLRIGCSSSLKIDDALSVRGTLWIFGNMSLHQGVLTM